MGDNKRIEITLTGDPSGLKKAALEAADAIDRLQKSGEKLTASTKSHTEAADRFLEKMKQEAIQLSAGDLALRKYQLSTLGLNDAQLKSATALAESIDKLRQHERAARDASQGQESLTGAMFKGAIGADIAMQVFNKLVGTYKEMKAATLEAQQAQLRTDAVLRASGEAAGGKREIIDRLAKSMQQLTRFDDDQVRSTAQQVLKLGLSNETFEKAITLGADLAVTYNRDLTTATMTLAKALVEPGEALGGVELMMGKFDPAIKRQIKNFADMNEQGRAQDLILREVSRVTGVAEGSYSGLERTTRGLSKAWDDLLKAVGKGIWVETEKEASYLEKRFTNLTSAINSNMPTWLKALDVLGSLSAAWVPGMDLPGQIEARKKWANGGNVATGTIKRAPVDDRADKAMDLLGGMRAQYRSSNDMLEAELARFRKLVADTGLAASQFADIEKGIRAKYEKPDLERERKNKAAQKADFESYQIMVELGKAYYKEKERMRQLDDKGWVASIDAQIKAYEDELTALGRLAPSHNQTSDKAVKDLADFLDPAKAESFGDALAGSFGTAGDALGKLTTALQDYGRKEAEIAKMRAEAQKINDPEKRAAIEIALAKKTTQTQMGAYGDMASAAAGFFDTQSKGYQSLMAVSQVFHAAELAMTIAELVPKAIGAVLNQGDGDPYTAFGRMAAMAAIVAGLGVALGGGGGGGVDTTAQDRQAAAGTGTTLGDSKAKSASIANAIEILSNNSVIGNEHTAGMLASLRNIENDIGGLASLVVRTTGLLGGKGDLAGLGLGTQSKGFLGLGRSTNSLSDQGILFGAQTVGQARQGFTGSQYSDVTTSGRTWYGASYSRTNRITGALDADLGAQFSRIIDGLSGSILAAAKALGGDGDSLATLLNNFNIEALDISLKGLNGAEIEEALAAVFGKLGDDMAAAVMPGLAAFQQVGEGLFETLMRLAQEFAATDAVARMLGKDVATAFGAVGFASMEARTHLVALFGGIEEFSTAAQKYFDLYYTDGEKLALSVGTMRDQFNDLGLAMPMTSRELRALIEAQDLSTESGRTLFAALVKLAPAFDAIQSAATDLIDKMNDLKQSAYEFRMANAARINRYGGAIDIGGIASGRVGELQGQIDNGSPEDRMQNISLFLGAVDDWVSAEAAAMQANAAGAAAIASAQAAATQSRITGLQKELALTQQWTGVLNSAQQAIDKMRLTGSNPLGALGRQALASEDVEGLLGQYRGAKGASRIELANRLLSAVNTRQGLNESAFQRPSDEYLTAYNDNMAILAEISGDAKTESEKQTELQTTIATLTEEAARYSAAAAGSAAQANAQLAGIHAQARELAIWAQEKYDLAAGEQENLLREQLMLVTGGMDVALYQAQMLTSINTQITAFLTGASNPGTTAVTLPGAASVSGPAQGPVQITIPVNIGGQVIEDIVVDIVDGHVTATATRNRRDAAFS